jgi:nucleotide-binding universal stress UspA family protein
MYEKILIPLDGSEVAEAVIPNVADLIRRMTPTTSITVTLLQVVSLLTYNVLTEDERAQIPYSDEDMKEIRKKATDYLEKVAEDMRAKGIKVKTLVAAGHAAEEIIKAAEAAKVNLIAMSTHGFSGVKRWALGSVADKVLHESRIPVLIVRAK